MLIASLLALPVGARAGDADVSVLLHKLVHGSRAESDRAIERLRYLGPSVAGPSLRVLLDGEDVKGRIAASAALAVVRDPRSASTLARRLAEDEDWEVRRNCADALAALRSKSSSQRLETCVLEDPHVRVRRACVKGLATLGTGTRALARVAAKDADLETRLGALDALARGLDRAAAPLVRPLLEDRSGLVRFAAARTLGWLGDAKARPFLARHATGDAPEEARRAVQVLADVPKSWALEELANALASADLDTRHTAAVALARRGDVRGRVHLSRAALHAEGEELRRAVQACEDLGLSPAERRRLSEDPH